MAAQSNRLIFGAAQFGSADRPDEVCQNVLDVLKSNGVSQIDTAQLYGMGESEAAIGRIKALEQGFTVDTKWIGGFTGKNWATYDNIVKTAKESLQKLGVDKAKGLEVDIFYMHSPDTGVQFEETLRGIDEAYRAGGFKRFGLSNYSVGHVKEVLEVCKQKGYVLPSVYQGNYSAIARRAEDELFPLLRQHNISFYAYSPIGGGFLVKTRKFIEDRQGRFSPDAIGGLYAKMYNQPTFLTLLDEWGNVASEEGISKAELAFRWVNYHGALKPDMGDGVIFGASKNEQIEQTVSYLRKGPLSQSAAKKIDELWDGVKNDAFMDNFEAAFSSA